jgi:hypothetical protein
MKAADLLVFTKRITITASIFNEPMDEVKTAGYFQALADLDLSTFLAAIGRAEKACKFMPRPADIIESAYHSPEADRQRKALVGYCVGGAPLSPSSLDSYTVEQVAALYECFFPRSQQPALPASQPPALVSGRERG